MCFSFIYTEKTVNVVKEHDDIMIEIKKNLNKYEKESSNATIIEQTIIPGISGEEVDIDTSYNKMKRYGKYNESLIEVKKKLPEISIKDNYDKFVIGGNPTKNQVSLIFLATKGTDITKIRSILKEKEVKANFFIDFYFYDNETIKQLAIENHEIGNLSLNYDYTDSSFAWLTSKIKKVTNTTYCYTDSFNIDTLVLCSAAKLYTISPSIITSSRPLYEVKKEVKNGSIIAFHITEALQTELPTIINYLKSKNLDIVTLSSLLEE